MLKTNDLTGLSTPGLPGVWSTCHNSLTVTESSHRILTDYGETRASIATMEEQLCELAITRAGS